MQLHLTPAEVELVTAMAKAHAAADLTVAARKTAHKTVALAQSQAKAKVEVRMLANRFQNFGKFWVVLPPPASHQS